VDRLVDGAPGNRRAYEPVVFEQLTDRHVVVLQEAAGLQLSTDDVAAVADMLREFGRLFAVLDTLDLIDVDGSVTFDPRW
jgi:hypothetical protein